MHVSPLVWGVTVGVLILVLIVDVLIIGRRPHEPSMKECGLFVGAFSAMAILFGIGIWYFYGGKYAGEFFAGWITEYSLSIDNLFVFLLIMGNLAVPRKYQQYALLVGIVLALIFRAIFIAVGAAVIDRFAWVFFLFGAFLLITAVKLVMDQYSHQDEEEAGRGWFLNWLQRTFPATEEYHGTKQLVKIDGRWVMTPMLIVIVALGTTDVMFALDSIPAIYGLTQEPYLVFTANVFALMGLRQLYFLLGGLLRKLVYLSLGLAVVLGFIGVKLVLHAMHEYGWDKAMGFNGEISTGLSLVVIISTLVITAVASLIKSRRDAQQGVTPPEPVERAELPDK